MKGLSQAVPAQSMPSPASWLVPSATSRGRLVDFDSVELHGWIEGDDGVIYSFSAADVIDDQDIAVGAVVSFTPDGETASAVHGLVDDGADRSRALIGELLSYDATALTGWIGAEGGDLYAFGAADVVGDEDLVLGQSVAFQGLGERAQAIRALPASSFVRLEGQLLSYDAGELRGWITGDDGNVYAFTADEIIGEREIASGQRVEFLGADERATHVVPLAPAAVSRDLLGTLTSYDPQALWGWITGDDGNLYGFTAGEVVDEDELVPEQRVTFSAAGEYAAEVRACPAPMAKALDGILQTYDAADLVGVVVGTDGDLYHFTGADLADDDEIEPGRTVRFLACDDRATEIRSLPMAPARELDGTVLSYDVADLWGWITGRDDNLYTFSAADVVGDDAIEVGQDVSFLGTGERAREVRPRGDAVPQSLRGTLVSYDPAELCGWIEANDGNLYAFMADDVAGDEEIAPGQAVAFEGANERAHDVRAVEPTGRPRALRGTLSSYSADDLVGCISGEDRATYRFDASDILGDAELRVGQVVTFVALGQRATQIAETMPHPVTAPAVPLRAPILVQLPPGPAATPEFEGQAPPRSLVPWMTAAALLALLGAGAVLVNRFALGPFSANHTVAAPAITVSPAARDASMAADTVTQTPTNANAAELPEPGDGATIATNPPEVPAPLEPQAPARPADDMVTAHKPLASAKPAAVAANVADGSGIVEKKPAARSPSPPPNTGKPTAWWGASAPGELNVVYVGRVAEVSAIALMFDGEIRSAAAVNEHVRVMHADGRPVVTRWVLARNPRMAVLRTSPGRYEVSVGAGLTDVLGRAVKRPQQGPVIVE